MPQFSSGKHAKLNADPFPDVIDGERYGGVGQGGGWPESGENGGYWVELGGAKINFDPRPEFDRPLTNPVNPILDSFRGAFMNNATPLHEEAMEWLDDVIPDWEMVAWPDVNPDHIDHASKVLQRLAKFKEGD